MIIYKSELKKQVDEMIQLSLDYIDSDELLSKIQSNRREKHAAYMKKILMPDNICIPNPQLSDINKLGLYTDSNTIMYAYDIQEDPITHAMSASIDKMPILDEYIKKNKSRYRYILVSVKVTDIKIGDIIFDPMRLPNSSSVTELSNYCLISRIEKSTDGNKSMLTVAFNKLSELNKTFANTDMLFVVKCIDIQDNKQNSKNTQHTQSSTNNSSKKDNINDEDFLSVFKFMFGL